MTIKQILDAKPSLIKLNKIRFSDFKIVSKVYKLSKNIDSALELANAEQDKIIQTYVKKDANGNSVIINNQYQFATEQDRLNFINEIEKLRNQEIEELNKIDIPTEKVQIVNDFSAEDMLLLDSIINWI